ncbi:MAG: serine/threonine-protein kinase [bacterium]|nr:serine/threonine-protein kinase [bacterium]
MSANRPSADNLSGKTLGQFEVLEEIGRGGMATVYTARQKSINRIVALKVLPPSLLHDPSFYERFTREVDVIAHLEHPHIVPIYDYGEADGIPFIAMRYLAGGSIASYLRRGLPTIEALERPLSQVGQALDYAHMRGVIHRDLKPGNVLLDEYNNAYLTDFGIARVLNSNLTGSAIIGTPAYMSPEQANGQPLDGRSDVYAMGIVLFEMLTGREPFYADTPLALMLKHLNEPIPSIREFRPEVPAMVESVIVKATAKHPGDRYTTAGEIAQAYSEALRLSLFELRGLDHPTIPPTGSNRLTPPPTPSAYTPPPQPVTPRPPTGGGSRPAVTPAPMNALDGGTLTPGKLTAPGQPPSTPRPPTPPPFNTADPYPTVRDVDGAAFAARASGTNPAMQPAFGSTPRRSRVPLLAAVFLTAFAAVTLALLLIPALFQRDLPLPPLPPGWSLYEGDDFNVFTPEGWSYEARSDDQRTVHVWNDDNNALFSVAVFDASIRSLASYDYAVERYRRRYYASDDLQDLELVSPDEGWLRQSYAVTGDSTLRRSLDAGQIDVFYLREDPFLVVVETYTAYATENTYVDDLQMMLDSLRIS